MEDLLKTCNGCTINVTDLAFWYDFHYWVTHSSAELNNEGRTSVFRPFAVSTLMSHWDSAEARMCFSKTLRRTWLRTNILSMRIRSYTEIENLNSRVRISFSPPSAKSREEVRAKSEVGVRRIRSGSWYEMCQRERRLSKESTVETDLSGTYILYGLTIVKARERNLRGMQNARSSFLRCRYFWKRTFQGHLAII